MKMLYQIKVLGDVLGTFTSIEAARAWSKGKDYGGWRATICPIPENLYNGEIIA